MKKKLKLFIWEDFCPDWTPGLAFAIAETEDEAKNLVIKNGGSSSNWGNLTVKRLDQRIARSVCGGA